MQWNSTKNSLNFFKGWDHGPSRFDEWDRGPSGEKMAAVIQIPMKRGEGKTPTAIALVKGMIEAGVDAVLIVPNAKARKHIEFFISPQLVYLASEFYWSIRKAHTIYVIDDAEHCDEIFRRHGEGDLLPLLQSRLVTMPFSKIYLMTHTHF